MLQRARIDASRPESRAAPGATSFAIMFALEAISRGSISTVVPLQAFAILGSARDVSTLFVVVAFAGLIASFVIPTLVWRLGRHRVYALGGACLVLCAASLATETLAGQVVAMLARGFGAACLNITLSLYIMSYIPKRELVRSEPRRYLYSALAWSVGPSLGVFLQVRCGWWTPYAFSGGFALLVLANFWRLGLSRRAQERSALGRSASGRSTSGRPAASRRPPNPLAAILRFIRQPRLRLAWAISFARMCWWGIFLNYVPLFLVSSGVDREVSGLAASFGNAFLFLTPLWGRIGAKVGVRRAIIGGFVIAGSAAAGAWLLSPWPGPAATVMVFGALGATCLDALGTIPFMRAVHPYERSEMMTVWRTNLDAADFASNVALTLLLSFFTLPVVFAAAATVTLALALISRHLPRRL